MPVAIARLEGYVLYWTFAAILLAVHHASVYLMRTLRLLDESTPTPQPKEEICTLHDARR